MVAMSSAVAPGPAIEIARSPDSRVITNARVMTVAVTSSATIRRRTRNWSMRAATLVRFVPERDHANCAPKFSVVGAQTMIDSTLGERASLLYWGSHAGVQQSSAHALLRCRAFAGRHRGDRRRGAGDDSGGVPPSRRQ